MLLYHITSVLRWEKIRKDGYLRTTESNIRPDGSGPRVVWLTDNPEPEQGWQATEYIPRQLLPLVDTKDSIRITVSLPEDEPQHWPAWSKKRGIARWWYVTLAKTGGDPTQWWVITRRIPFREIVRVEDIRPERDGTGPAVQVWPPV